MKFYKSLSPELVQQYHQVQSRASLILGEKTIQFPDSGNISVNGNMISSISCRILDLSQGAVSGPDLSLVGKEAKCIRSGISMSIPTHSCKTVLPYIPGDTMHTGIISEWTRSYLSREICQQLDILHIPITGKRSYGGISPENIKMSEENNTTAFCITDIGGSILSTLKIARESKF